MMRTQDFRLNAGWRDFGHGKAVCRWFIAWRPVGRGKIVGAVAGYGGGGAFTVEMFLATTKGGKVTSLWGLSSGFEAVAREYVECPGLTKDMKRFAQKALSSCLWKWNDFDHWNETGRVVLRKGKRSEVVEKGGLLGIATHRPRYLVDICAVCGITARPAVEK